MHSDTPEAETESSRVRPTLEPSRAEFDSRNSTFLKFFSDSVTCFVNCYNTLLTH
jgi:hypothetical protein